MILPDSLLTNVDGCIIGEEEVVAISTGVFKRLAVSSNCKVVVSLSHRVDPDVDGEHGNCMYSTARRLDGSERA